MDVWSTQSTGKGRAAASEEQAALASVKYHIIDRPGNLWDQSASYFASSSKTLSSASTTFWKTLPKSFTFHPRVFKAFNLACKASYKGDYYSMKQHSKSLYANTTWIEISTAWALNRHFVGRKFKVESALLQRPYFLRKKNSFLLVK